MEFVAAPVRQREGGIALANACEIRRQITQPMGDEVHDLAFSLDAAVDPNHTGREHDTAVFLEHLYPSCNSSSPMRKTPLCETDMWERREQRSKKALNG